MTRRLGPAQAPLLILALVALVAVVAIPALAAGPSASPGDNGAGKAAKASKEPEVAVTLRGVVAVTTDADGEAAYTLTADGKTVRLDAGPGWYWKDKNPLAAHVGKTVTVSGGQRGDELDVETVDGTRLRAEGKPPWAGGWKSVGKIHPGWTQAKWDRWQQKQAGKAGALGADGSACWPPGKCKDPAAKASAGPGG